MVKLHDTMFLTSDTVREGNKQEEMVSMKIFDESASTEAFSCFTVSIHIGICHSKV